MARLDAADSHLLHLTTWQQGYAGHNGTLPAARNAARCLLQSHAEYNRTLVDAYFLVTYAAAGGRLSAALCGGWPNLRCGSCAEVTL